MEKIGLCIKGCGRWARVHATNCSSLRHEVDLFFLSRDISKARRYCREFGGVDYFNSFEKSASDPRIDAYILCTPHKLHYEEALFAITHKKNVLVEKPMTCTLEEADRLIKAVRDTSLKLMVAENYRFIPAIAKAKKLIAEGKVGQLKYILVNSIYHYPPKEWRSKLEMSGGGVLIDMGIHYVDAILNLGGEVSEVYSVHVPKSIKDLEGEDTIIVTAQFKNGGVAQMNISWGTYPDLEIPHFIIVGSDATITINLHKCFMKIIGKINKNYFIGFNRFLSFDKYGRKGLLIEFINSIKEDRDPIMNGEEGRKDLEFVLKAYESLETRKPIALLRR